MDLIEVSSRCVACGEEPEHSPRCNPTPDRVAKLQWYRDQPGLELRENIGTGHIVAVGVKQPRANDPDPE